MEFKEKLIRNRIISPGYGRSIKRVDILSKISFIVKIKINKFKIFYQNYKNKKFKNKNFKKKSISYFLFIFINKIYIYKFK